MKIMAGITLPISEEYWIREIQYMVRQHFGTEVPRMMPHITMKIPFSGSGRDVDQFKQMASEFLFEDFELEMEGFGFWERVVYIKFKQSVAWDQFSEDWNGRLCGVATGTDFNRVPHITICKGRIHAEPIADYLNEWYEGVMPRLRNLEVSKITPFAKNAWGEL